MMWHWFESARLAGRVMAPQPGIYYYTNWKYAAKLWSKQYERTSYFDLLISLTLQRIDTQNYQTFCQKSRKNVTNDLICPKSLTIQKCALATFITRMQSMSLNILKQHLQSQLKDVISGKTTVKVKIMKTRKTCIIEEFCEKIIKDPDLMKYDWFEDLLPITEITIRKQIRSLEI